MGCFSNPTSTAASTPVMPGWMSETLQQNSVRATGLSNTPFQSYSGQLVAPMNATQGAATGVTQGLASTNVLNGAGNNGTINGLDLSGYMNPFTQNVINASDANLDKQYGKAQAAQSANGVMAAGFGGYGDRQAASDAELASNYALQKNQLDSNLYAQNFTNAQQLAQQGVSNQLQGNISNAGIQQGAANSLFNQGTVAQTTDQAANDANYSEFMRQINDPYSKLAYATQISTGTAPFFTGQTTTSHVSAPSALQIAGGLIGGFAGAGGMAGLAGGGRVGLAAGGSTTPGDRRLAAILDSLLPDNGYQRGGEIDPRQLNQQIEAERQRLYQQNLPADELSARLAELSARHAQAGGGLRAGATYREPTEDSEGGAWARGLPPANGAVGQVGLAAAAQPEPVAPQQGGGLSLAGQGRPAPPSGFDERVLDLLGRPQQSDAEPGGFQARMSRRLTDPNYAFSRFLLRAGLATLSATGVNGLSAIGQGVSHGLQAAERESEAHAAQEAERINGGARLIQQHRLGLGAAAGNPTEIERMYRRIRELEQTGQGDSPEAQALRQRVSKLAGGEEGGLTANQLATSRARARSSAEQEAGRMHFPSEEARRAWIEDRTEESFRADIGRSADSLPAHTPRYSGPAPVPREAVPAGMVPDWQNPGRTMVAPDSRDLPQHELDLLVNGGSTRQTMEGFLSTFRPEFTNKPLVGGLQNTLGSILPGTPEWDAQGRWWRGYNEWVNQFRNSLFGASLTVNEQRAFAASTVDQSMKPETVTEYLERQRAVVESAIRRRAGALAARGVRRAELAEAVGLPVDDLFALSPSRQRGGGQPAGEQRGGGQPQEGERRTIDGKPAMFHDGQWYEIRPRTPPAATGLGATVQP